MHHRVGAGEAAYGIRGEIWRRGRREDAEFHGEVGQAWWPAGTTGHMAELRALALEAGLAVIDKPGGGWVAEADVETPYPATLTYRAGRFTKDGVAYDCIFYKREFRD